MEIGMDWRLRPLTMKGGLDLLFSMAFIGVLIQSLPGRQEVSAAEYQLGFLVILRDIESLAKNASRTYVHAQSLSTSFLTVCPWSIPQNDSGHLFSGSDFLLHLMMRGGET